MKTPIQQLINRLDYLIGLSNDTLYKFGLKCAKKEAEQMLEKEKEVIMYAHHCGRAFENKYSASAKHYDESVEQYYNETFNTKEK